ncbi:MAG TPA: glycosyltransferase [Mucilaginibacter sp.]|nr:glycosyltransferase [Mucilaginibacter sp.]
MPAYNAGRYIAESIQSVIDQTYKNWELIIVNDGSTDDTQSIIARFEKDERIRSLVTSNAGASAARNRGLTEARGKYIQFLDADDLLSADKIEKQVNLLAGTTKHVAVCSTVHFPDGQDPESFKPSEYEELFLQNIQTPVDFLIRLWGGYDDNGSMIQPNAWLIPAEVIEKAGPWDEQLSLDDDGEFFARVILNSEGIVYTPGVFNFYRKQVGSLSGGRSLKNLESLLKSALSKKRELLSRNNSGDARHAIYRQLYGVFLMSYPKYPAIYKAALKELPETAKKPKVVLGGSVINTIAAIFGVRAALFLQHLKRKTEKAITI